MPALNRYLDRATVSRFHRKDRTVALCVSPSLEGFSKTLTEALPHLNFETASLEPLESSLESQQMDVAKHEKLMDELKEDLTQANDEAALTENLHVYVLGEGESDDTESGQAMLAAVVHHAIDNPASTVLALLPEDTQVGTDLDGGTTRELSANAQAAVDFLQSNRATVVTSTESLIKALA